LHFFPAYPGLEGGVVSSANNPEKKPQRSKSAGAERRSEKSVGDALRRVYSEAVQEHIPDEFLDLLNKLD
jgi:hypothetical protein